MTEREQKLQRTVEWLINLIEDAIDATDDYCANHCPVRDHDGYCPAELFLPEYDGEDEYPYWERDYRECMDLRVKFFVEKANG